MRDFDAIALGLEATELGITLADEERVAFSQLGDELLKTMEAIDGVAPLVATSTKHPVLKTGPDPLNAIVRRVRVASSQPRSTVLEDMRVAVKDCIAVAGVEMSAGSSALNGFIPSEHSEVVARLLDAGASIEAITNMDCMAMSAAGDSSHFGPVLCPHDPTRLAGGSSSGSAAILHYDDIDVAIGTDTGGSVRVPSAWCGVLGLKPTHGLVSYRGVLPIDQRFDHVGAMATTAADLARTMDVIAGPDGRDPRQRMPFEEPRFVEKLTSGRAELSRMRFAVLKESVAKGSGVEPPVREAFMAAMGRLKEHGAKIEFVSLPEHSLAGMIVFNMIPEGFRALMDAGGNGYQWQGEYWPELSEAIRRGGAQGTNQLSPQVKFALMLGRHMQRHYHGKRYAQAANLARRLKTAYDRLCEGFDAVLMPTVPTLPYVQDAKVTLADRIMRSWATLGNTSSGNITGHPAISMPLAVHNHLPVGVMAVGTRFGDADLVALAARLEADIGWNEVSVSPGHRK